MKRLIGVALVALAACVPARADKLIWIPSGNIQKLAIEYIQNTDDDTKILSAQVAFTQFELFGRHWQDIPGGDDETEIGGQLQILPEGLATPSLSLGMWDVADDAPRGRRAFVVLTKTLEVVNWLPFFSGVRVHGGVGTDSLGPLFFGAQGTFPFGVTLVAEFDSSHTNFGLWWAPVKPLRVKLESWGGDFAVGAQFVSPL